MHSGTLVSDENSANRRASIASAALYTHTTTESSRKTSQRADARKMKTAKKADAEKQGSSGEKRELKDSDWDGRARKREREKLCGTDVGAIPGES